MPINMKIQNFTEREKVMQLHNTFFDPDSDSNIEFLTEAISHYELLTKDQVKTFESILNSMGNILWSTLKNFDNNMSKNNTR